MNATTSSASHAISTSKPQDKARVYQLKVTLRGIRPPIWRRLLVPGDVTLADLHEILQVAMDWEDYHAWEFRVGRELFGIPDPSGWVEFQDAAESRLDEVVRQPKTKFQYIYDFGDNWVHDILVEKILPPEPGVDYPLCTGGKRAAPPEDCGGIFGYLEKLEIIQNPGHPEYEDSVEWLGESYDPEQFNPDLINERLRHLR
ncbi:MAG TPA: plasmid pRiA4b ORF-3 family protein [Firmicutes bacterium]|nr:plasmid pRiA4b ORF-3 family protein [Bacillota bacterium]